MKNKWIISLVLIIITGIGGFFAGIQYQKTQRSNFGNQFANLRNGQSNFPGRANFQGTRPMNGEIIGVDDKIITVKMQDGSSKIVILSDKTTINKASEGAKSDLKTGERITAFGTGNSDGSITAQNITIGSLMRVFGAPNKPEPTTVK